MMKKELLFLFIVINSTHLYSMKRNSESSISLKPIKKNKKRLEETNLPLAPSNLSTEVLQNPLQLKKYIDKIYSHYYRKINTLELFTLQQFQNNSGLKDESWNCFAQDIAVIKTYQHTKPLPPKNFIPYCSSHIPKNDKQELQKILQNNNICYEKISIFTTNDLPTSEELMEKVFKIQIPIYKKDIYGKYIFEPDILTINYEHYQKNTDFFNICICAAFRQKIMMIQRSYLFIFQQQITQLLQSCCFHNELFNFEEERLKERKKQLNIFIQEYGYRIGILRVILEHSEYAVVLKKSLESYPLLCNAYGIKSEDLKFFSFVEELHILKAKLNEIKDLEKEKKVELSEGHTQFIELQEQETELKTLKEDKKTTLKEEKKIEDQKGTFQQNEDFCNDNDLRPFFTGPFDL